MIVIALANSFANKKIENLLFGRISNLYCTDWLLGWVLVFRIAIFVSEFEDLDLLVHGKSTVHTIFWHSESFNCTQIQGCLSCWQDLDHFRWVAKHRLLVHLTTLLPDATTGKCSSRCLLVTLLNQWLEVPDLDQECLVFFDALFINQEVNT